MEEGENASPPREDGGGTPEPSNEEMPNWREYIKEDDLQVAIKVLQKIQEYPDLKACAKLEDGVLMRELVSLAYSALAPSKEERRARTKNKQKEKTKKDHELLQATAIRVHRKVTTDYKMVRLAPPPDTKMLTSVAEVDGLVEDVPEDDQSEAKEESAQSQEQSQTQEPGQPRLLNYARRCCICGDKFRELHHFYDKMCPPCAAFNWQKRNQEVDLSGRVALVTGGRVKIGFRVAMKLLRSGAFVIVTTRFPHDSVLRFAAEPDFQEWKDRLAVYGVDFRDIPAVHRFCTYLKAKYDRLDIIIGNAAQTVRRPPTYYRHLIEDEAKALPAPLAHLVPEGSERLYVASTQGAITISPLAPTPVLPGIGAQAPESEGGVGLTVAHSVALSQVPLMVGDEAHNEELFPKGEYDRDLQQLDLRTQNSWTQVLEEVSPVELMECHAINSFAPFIINSELKPLMEKSPATDKYIVNVSAMEGQFYRPNKTIYHPHTNMAKASLNMMTRTAAAGYAKSGIYMTCVDTGWITDENPVNKHEVRSLDPPPLDEVDAAMRILDPVLVGVQQPEARVYGVFLKDYKPTRW